MWWSDWAERRRLRHRALRYAAAEAKDGKLTEEERAVALAKVEIEITGRRYQRRYQGLPDPEDLRLMPLTGGSKDSNEETYARHYVRRTIHELISVRETYARNVRRYRWLRAIALAAAAAVPVVASITSAPRWVLGTLGAVAVFVEGINQAIRGYEQALLQMRFFGDVSRELDDFLNHVGRYAEADRFSTFTKRLSEVKAETGNALVGILQQATEGKGQQS
jgi:hypothetical protein